MHRWIHLWLLCIYGTRGSVVQLPLPWTKPYVKRSDKWLLMGDSLGCVRQFNMVKAVLEKYSCFCFIWKQSRHGIRDCRLCICSKCRVILACEVSMCYVRPCPPGIWLVLCTFFYLFLQHLLDCLALLAYSLYLRFCRVWLVTEKCTYPSDFHDIL